MTPRFRSFAPAFNLACALASACFFTALASSYTVRAGDTLYRVASSRGLDPAALISLNHLSAAALSVGQRLLLPESSGPIASAHTALGTAATQAISKTALPAGLPQVGAGSVRGPVAWKVEPAATVASFIGWVPTVSTVAFGNAVPIRTFLRGLSFDFQTYNNCGPSALASVLGFYKVQIGQDTIRKTTRRGSGYMQVSAIALELAQFGLRTVTIRDGQLSQIKRMLALGIPVIVLQWYDRPGHIPHFRVVRGYDDQAGIVWVSDSMVGPVAYLRYSDFDALWNTQGRQMFPVYPASYQSQIQALM
ncbi:LysM peptidoglycan-binding domain-containing protein [Deinococcus sp.]|uniref:LysM peptidoglycan-binding domain-containing protein n=1 Tax=Deinococcus sp. TaxID=47478 RepID=UPI003CC5BB05